MPWPVASRTMKHPGRSNMRQGRGKRVACWPDAASISRAPDKRPRPHGVCTCARASAGLPGGASPDTELSILPEVPSFHRPIQRGILLFSMKFSGRVPGQSARGPQRSGRRPSPRSYRPTDLLIRALRPADDGRTPTSLQTWANASPLHPRTSQRNLCAPIPYRSTFARDAGAKYSGQRKKKLRFGCRSPPLMIIERPHPHFDTKIA
jgi:hypothetical protein